MGSRINEEEKRVYLPFAKAVEIAVRNLRTRFGRSIITASGVMLGIAFLVSVQSGNIITNAATAGRGFTSEAQSTWLVVMSLLVCAVGITNAMLMSVTERFREIGTMKCLGALDRYIVEMFLLEALFQGFAGSLIGCVIGFIASLFSQAFKYGFGRVFSTLPVLELLGSMGIALLVGSILSVLAAIYPAYRAAKMPPAVAMRMEV
jgi:putative ABC transport system permease protein